jgi:undecaprenyl-diphosphatase
MNNNYYLLSVLLGIVEGITEFLPVSSTAHLRITEHLLGIDLGSSYWKMYSIVIQLGAVLAVVVYFWKRIVQFVCTLPVKSENGRSWLTHPLTLVIGAFVVTAGPAYLLDKKIGQNLESLTVIGLALLIGGVLMWVVDAIFTRPRTTDMAKTTWPQAIWIGAAQILSAAFPGTSRSMATIAAGQTVGMSRSAALEFSFFLSIPVMFAATGFKLLQAARGKSAGEPIAMDAQKWVILTIGFVVSFFVAWGVIAWFMAWVRQRGFTPFAVYRILLGLFVLLMLRNHAAAPAPTPANVALNPHTPAPYHVDR